MKKVIVLATMLAAGGAMAQDDTDQTGMDLAAQISGEAAGLLTFLMEQCAQIAGNISEERMVEVRDGLSSDRDTFEGSENIFDQHFEIGTARAEAGEVPEANEETCARAIEIMRSDDPVLPPRG